ncbi:MBL fold metallo-hydrolase [Cellulomonas sp. SLBN-39]|uniref:MBL fold metallo-hydrolase n=1 Tax=Cellulomonas sp. SLBN-39 TaxID=2768446 RepID=UPI00116ACA3A|nr:MBL fold metallo-hydrolase [Cellulomonas sp. SLBN-39]TQL04143.1 L-ascorbate metabolism protein UlaG (beta-lactamase superfamily) [Cellulomonas sp. SLBN-39]
MPLTLTRHGHACVRLTRDDGARLVVDPGSFSDVATALDGVDAVLVTHEHPDHLDTDAVVAATGRGVQVWAPAAVVEQLAAVGAPVAALHAVQPGDALTVGGLDVQVLGGWHEVIHPDVPRLTNVAYLVEGAVLHPGDAFTLPPAGAAVRVLLEPVGAPWLRMADAVDHVRAVAPDRVVPIHDATLSDAGRALAARLLGQLTTARVVEPAAGEPVEV